MESWLGEIYCDLQVRGSHVLIYWWHFPASRVTWVLWSVDKVKGLLLCPTQQYFQTNWGRWRGFFVFVFFLSCGWLITKISSVLHSIVLAELYNRSCLPRADSTPKAAAGVTEINVSRDSNDPEWLCWLWFRGCWFCFKLCLALWLGALCCLKGCRGINTKLIMLWLNLLASEICLWRPMNT